MSYVNSVTVYPSSATITKGKWYYGAYASIASDYPECAEVEWYSNSPTIASVNKTTGYIYGVSTGTTRIYAEATDGSGKKDYITVTVIPPVSVTGVSVYPTSLTMNVGDTDYICETVCPSNATNQTVTWSSSDESVATVNTYTGKVTAKKAGTTTITACTVDGGFRACCTVMVKEMVIIVKDADYSNVVFNDGKIWKCNSFYCTPESELKFPVDKQRAIHNNSIDFTVKQLGFLFRIDPDGVIYYVKNKRLEGDASSTDLLIYKDDIFKEIYGRQPQYFTYEDSQVYYWTGINRDNRYGVYSEAELIFGMHLMWTWQNVIETLLGAVVSIISIYVPAISVASLTLDLVTAFFFTDAFCGAVNAAANEYISECIDTKYGEKAVKRFGWATTIVDLIPSLVEGALPPDIDEGQISIFENAYKNESYLIKVSDSNQTVDLSEFIEHYKSLIPA